MTYIKLDDAIAAVEGERLNEGTGSESDAGYERALDHAIGSLRALPTVSVTDEMVEVAARAIVRRNWPSLTDSDVDDMWESHTGDARAALEAALGPLPAPPTIGE